MILKISEKTILKKKKNACRMYCHLTPHITYKILFRFSQLEKVIALKWDTVHNFITLQAIRWQIKINIPLSVRDIVN